MQTTVAIAMLAALAAPAQAVANPWHAEGYRLNGVPLAAGEPRRLPDPRIAAGLAVVTPLALTTLAAWASWNDGRAFPLFYAVPISLGAGHLYAGAADRGMWWGLGTSAGIALGTMLGTFALLPLFPNPDPCPGQAPGTCTSVGIGAAIGPLIGPFLTSGLVCSAIGLGLCAADAYRTAEAATAAGGR